MTRVRKEEFGAYGRLGFSGRLKGREKDYWDNLQETNGFFLLTQSEKDSIYSQIVAVTTSSDLSGTLDSTKAYVIDGVVDMGGTSIAVPSGGLSIMGHGFGVSKLITSDTNATLFTGASSGDLFLTSLEVEVTGTGGKVFDLTNGGSGAIEFNTVNFNNCTSLGSLKDYRQLLARNVAFFAPQDGLEFLGPWSGGLAVVDTIVILLPASTTLFKAGTGFLVGSSVRSNMNAISVNASAAVWDFSPSNFTPDGAFSLTNFRTSATDPLPNIASSSVKVNFASCTGIRNTYPGGNWTIGTAIATTGTDSLVKLAGTTTYSNLEWFSGSVTNAFHYDSTLEIDVTISATLSFSGGNNDQIVVQLRLFDDSASAYVNIGPEFTATMNSAGRVENVNFQGITTVNKDDRIEVWVRNVTDSSNITAEVGGEVLIQQRSSI